MSDFILTFPTSSLNGKQQYHQPYNGIPSLHNRLTDELIDDLHKSIHPTIISGMKYLSRWPKKLRYGLYNHCYPKLQHFGLEQLLAKVSSIHKFVNHTDYRNIFTNIIDSYQLASGISTPILKLTQWKVQYVNSVWTSHLIYELHYYNVQIKSVNLLQIEPQRINDSNLIENEIISAMKRSLTIK